MHSSSTLIFLVYSKNRVWISRKLESRLTYQADTSFEQVRKRAGRSEIKKQADVIHRSRLLDSGYLEPLYYA